MKYLWISLGIIAFFVIIFLIMRKRPELLPQVIVNKLPASQTVIINKTQGQQWTREELKTQGYTDAQINAASNTAFNVGTMFV